MAQPRDQQQQSPSGEPSSVSYDRLRAAFDALSWPVVIFTVDDGRIEDANRAARTLLPSCYPSSTPRALAELLGEIDAASILEQARALDAGEAVEPITSGANAQRGDRPLPVSRGRVQRLPESSSAVLILGHADTGPAIAPRPDAAASRIGVAWRDPLTGLATRDIVLRQLGLLVDPARGEEAETVAILMIDIDGFKQVNDTQGHLAGDTVLEQLAQRMQHGVRPGDVVARFGGDEFVVLARSIVRTDDALAIGRRLLKVLGERVQVGETSWALSASIGIVVTGVTSVDARALIDQADRAMYRAKAAGGNRLEFVERTA
jgi:diguanylate cyclase (GGDEF)-like protein